MKKIYWGLCALLSFGFYSCGQDDTQNIEGQGYIEVQVSADKKLVSGRSNGLSRGDAPDTGDFSLSVVSESGGVVASCDKYSDFKPLTVQAGTYVIHAWYGDTLSEGFDALSYAGSEKVLVKRKETTEAVVTCTISKALVYIDYTDDFKKYFPTYSASVSTAKGNKVAYSADEARAAYFVPGQLNVFLNVKKQNAEKSVELNPKTFTAEARHEYHLTMDVDASTATLSVSFTDETGKQETVDIDVSDEALNAPAPVLTANGFTSGETLEIVEGFPENGSYNLYLNAQGGVEKLNLTAQSAWWTSKGYPETQELVGLNLSNGQSWNGCLRLIGLSENRDKIAGVEFLYNTDGTLSGLLSKLSCSGTADEEHTFTFIATDKLTKVSEPVVLKVRTLSDQLAIQASGDAQFGGNELGLTITVRGASEDDVKSRFAYYYKGVDATGFTKLSQSAVSVEKGNGENEWNVTLKLSGESFAPGNLQVKVVSPAGHSQTLDYTVAPDLVLSYDSEGDIWAKKAILQLKPRNSGTFSSKNVKFQYQSGDTWGELTHTATDGGYVVTGLTPGTAYTVREVYTVGSESYVSNTVTFTTEAATQIPNSDFETWSSEKVWEKTIFLSGGEKIYSYYPYSGSSEAWWNTLNGITTQSQSGVASWYYCAYPGTMPTNASEVHTATWHLNNHDGKSLSTASHGGNAAAEIATVGYGANNWSDFSHNTSNRQAGQLYIGTFDSSSKEPTYGHAFTSRPLSVGFYYRFYSYNNETTKAYAQVLDKDGNVIASGELKITSDTDTYTLGTIALDYTNTTAKAASLSIVFMSTDAESPATKDIQGSKGAVGNGYGDSRHIGSIFTVDDVTLNY